MDTKNTTFSLDTGSIRYHVSVTAIDNDEAPTTWDLGTQVSDDKTVGVYLATSYTTYSEAHDAYTSLINDIMIVEYAVEVPYDYIL